jgi:hypothetical protein
MVDGRRKNKKNILSLTQQKKRTQNLGARRWLCGTLNPESRKKVKTKLYVTESNTPGPDLTTHNTDDLEEDDCKNNTACITQPIESLDFVTEKFVTKKKVRYLFRRS